MINEKMLVLPLSTEAGKRGVETLDGQHFLSIMGFDVYFFAMKIMSPKNEQALFARWPDWFRSSHNLNRSLMRFGFQSGDGWFRILWRLFEHLESLTPELKRAGPAFEVLQVKQKMGELRVAVNRTTPSIESAIEAARQKSIQTCETCGGSGKRRTDHQGWWATKCQSCRISDVVSSIEEGRTNAKD